MIFPRPWHSPALRFLVLGAGLWALQQAAQARHRAPVVLEAPTDSLRAELRAELHRSPTDAELRARAEVWADHERLFREAVAHRVWESDPVLRQRLEERAAWALRDPVGDAPPTEADLARTLARHPERYQGAPRTSFEQVFVARALHPDDAPGTLAAVDAALVRGDDPAHLGDAPPFGRSAVASTGNALATTYGQPFADAISGLAVGAWSPPVETPFGWHRVRVTQRFAGQPLTAAQLGARLVADWRDDQRSDLDVRLRDRLRARYPLRLRGVSDR